MRYSSFLSVTLLSVTLPLFTSAAHQGPSARRHNALANRKRNETEARDLGLRDSGARATFYDVGLGACGKTNGPDDFIVALNSCQYGGGYPGPHCFKMITINYKGKSTQAQITDECPGCPCGGLDMSRGLFKFFEPESAGVFYMDWSYNDGSGGPAPSSSKKPKPSSTWTILPSSSSSWSAPSSTWSPSSSKWSSSSSAWSSSSTWSSSSSSWSSSSTSHNSTSTSTSYSSTPSATPSPTYSPGGTADAPQNLDGLNALIVGLGKMVAQYGA